jgi:Zn ribbon nucleic-acid-binding protein
MHSSICFLHLCESMVIVGDASTCTNLIATLDRTAMRRFPLSMLMKFSTAQVPYLLSQSENRNQETQHNFAQMATMANNNHETSQPTCQNCTTSTTPLWRRDEIGSVLCNACGLFLKLHGRPRPISLKTDVIKSRNRVKSSGSGGPQGAKKKVSALLHVAASGQN